jgi:hypothetical protein
MWFVLLSLQIIWYPFVLIRLLDCLPENLQGVRSGGLQELPTHQADKLIIQNDAGAQGMYTGIQILWSGLLELHEKGIEDTEKVDLAGGIIGRDFTEGLFLVRGKVTGIEGGDRMGSAVFVGQS